MKRKTANFDRLARIYRWLEYISFGPWLERCRYAQLDQLHRARRALLLGEGDGRFLATLLQSNRKIVADVVDSSPAMLRQIDRRVTRLGLSARRRVRLHCMDLQQAATIAASPELGGYDLVVTHFSLDCLPAAEIDRLIAGILPRLASPCRWLVSEFAIPRSAPMSYLSAALIALLYQAFGLLTGLAVRSLPDYSDPLRRHGFRSDRERAFLAGLLRSEIWLLNPHTESATEPANALWFRSPEKLECRMPKLLSVAALAAVLPLAHPVRAQTVGQQPITGPAGAIQPLPEDALTPRIASYWISARIDPDARTVDGAEVVQYRNVSGQPLSSFPFHVYLNAYRAQSSFSRELRQNGGSPGPSMAGGGVEISSLSAEGYGDLLPAMSYPAPDDRNPDDHTVMEVALPQPLGPGETIRFHISFRDHLPRTGARQNAQSKFILGALWYPVIGVFQGGAWNCHQFHAEGGSLSDFAVYNVNLTMPRRYLAAASGIETGERNLPGDLKVVGFRGEDIRDFAWAAAPDFLVAQDQIRNRLGGVKLIVLARQSESADRLLAILKRGLQKLDAWYGPYPYPQITVVDPGPDFLPAADPAAESYPMLLAAHAPWWTPSWAYAEPEAVVVHQLALQYWRDLVAPDGIKEPWLEEGLASYSESRIMASLFGEKTSILNANTVHSGDGEMQRVALIGVPGYDPITRRVWEFAGGAVSAAGAKTSTSLSMLSAIVGEDTLRAALRLYFTRYEFQHPNGANFLDTVEAVSGRKDLEAYFNQAVSGAGVLDYAVDSVTSIPGRWTPGSPGGYHTSVLLHRLGDFTFPVMVEVGFSDGSKEWATWDGAGQWMRFSWDKAGKALYARTDPLQAVPLDANFFNNSYILEPHPIARYKLVNYWVAAQQLLAQWISFLV